MRLMMKKPKKGMRNNETQNFKDINEGEHKPGGTNHRASCLKGQGNGQKDSEEK